MGEDVTCLSLLLINLKIHVCCRNNLNRRCMGRRIEKMMNGWGCQILELHWFLLNPCPYHLWPSIYLYSPIHLLNFQPYNILKSCFFLFRCRKSSFWRTTAAPTASRGWLTSCRRWKVTSSIHFLFLLFNYSDIFLNLYQYRCNHHTLMYYFKLFVGFYLNCSK